MFILFQVTEMFLKVFVHNNPALCKQTWNQMH